MPIDAEARRKCRSMVACEGLHGDDVCWGDAPRRRAKTGLEMNKDRASEKIGDTASEPSGDGFTLHMEASSGIICAIARRIICPVVMPCWRAADSNAITCQRGRSKESSTTSAAARESFGSVLTRGAENSTPVGGIPFFPVTVSVGIGKSSQITIASLDPGSTHSRTVFLRRSLSR